MNTIDRRIAIFLALLAGFSFAGCDHQSVASHGTPPAVAATPAETPAQATVSTPAPEIQQVSAAESVAEPGVSNLESAPKSPGSTRAPVDRTPVSPGGPQKITFDDLNLGMDKDMVFRPFLVTDRVKQLDGTKVRITGFIHGGASSTKGTREFVLLKNTECKFGAGGQADHLAMVYLAKGETTKYQVAAIKVEGTLKVKPYEGPDGNTWSVYDLTDAKVVQ